MPQENSDWRARLEKILRLEQSTGYRDAAVTCGLEAFLRDHLPELLPRAEGYSAAGENDRRHAVERLLQVLSPPSVAKRHPLEVPRIDLDAPITEADGVGTKRASLLAKLGIETIEDLILYFPRRLEDRTRFVSIGSVRMGESVCIRGEVAAVSQQRLRRGMNLVKAAVGDGTGFLYGVWFNQPWIAKQLNRGDAIDLFGRIERSRRELQMNSPVWEPAGTGIEIGRWVPVYPATEGVTDRAIRALIHRNLDACLPSMVELLPRAVREAQGHVPRRAAVEAIHRPADADAFEQARQALAFEELTLLQLGLLGTAREAPGRERSSDGSLVSSFHATLPFQLTSAQRAALVEMRDDLARPTRMMRLLQGDVGSGKTLVALSAALRVIDAGFQVAFMVPTEILAEQHAATFERLLADLPVTVRLLTGASKGKAAIRSGIEDGEVDLLVGTHALIQDEVSFRDLGLVIVDEQHRFGVVQRSRIEEKGDRVDVLVMSATPIPRTITLTLYGEFDVSVLDELPLGERAIETRWVEEKQREDVYRWVGGFLDAGRKGYVVLPLVSESEKLAIKAAVQVADELAEKFPSRGIGLIHGRLSSKEKADAMRAFVVGEARLLVATTVIEVGIDVPDADFIVIEHADRFGLSQLHQLRGRIGRAGQPSECIVIADATTEEATQRLRAFETHDDGFRLSEEDLRIRGPGDLLGTQQHGYISRLRAVDLMRDLNLMREARSAARRILERGPVPPDMGAEIERRYGEMIRFLRV